MNWSPLAYSASKFRWTIHSICCRRTYSFSALLVLLRYPPEGLHRQGPAAEIQFNDLVVKCLIKLTKALSTTMDVSKKAAHFFPGPVGHCTDKASCT